MIPGLETSHGRQMRVSAVHVRDLHRMGSGQEGSDADSENPTD